MAFKYARPESFGGTGRTKCWSGFRDKVNRAGAKVEWKILLAGWAAKRWTGVFWIAQTGAATFEVRFDKSWAELCLIVIVFRVVDRRFRTNSQRAVDQVNSWVEAAQAAGAS